MVVEGAAVGRRARGSERRMLGGVSLMSFADGTRARGTGFSDQPDALRIASHEDDLGSSPSELDRGGSPDAASSSREHDDSRAPDVTCARSPRFSFVDGYASRGDDDGTGGWQPPGPGSSLARRPDGRRADFRWLGVAASDEHLCCGECGGDPEDEHA
jgi:hypothetical protein